MVATLAAPDLGLTAADHSGLNSGLAEQPTTLEPIAKRLSVQVDQIAEDTTVIRSLDWDRDRFDIEFGLQNGTTYNSFVIRGEKIALVDTSHAKFRQLYLEALSGVIDPAQIDYIVISHTEPDHSGLVADVLQLAPQATIVGSKVALQFLDNLIHQPYNRLQVKSGESLDLGRGHRLEFLNAPNLHWPDTIFTYDHHTQVLYTCDAFGMHYCTEALYDEDLKAIEPDFRFYYECLMAPNARSVLAAMKRMDALPGWETIATGHGPLLRYNVLELTGRYRHWSQSKATAETTVAVFYTSDYGDSDRLSQAIAHGITKSGVAVEMLDLNAADPQEVRELVERAAALVVGTPPQGAAEAAIGTLLTVANAKQRIGIFEVFGGQDEPSYPLFNRFQDLGLKPAFEVLRVTEAPHETTYQTFEEAGTDLAQALTLRQAVQQMKSLDTELDKAIGRLSGGLYILTAHKGELTSAMLASWVTQASFKPLGITVAVAKDRAIESLLQVGDSFVLNVLEEGNYSRLMRHFLKRFAPGEDRFAGVETQTASNGSPILSESLAYLECRVTSRMDAGDHWIVYSTVEEGRVAKEEGLSAVHHRKVGNHY